MAAAGVISLPHLIVVLVIVLLLFGGNRLRNLGGDLGSAIKGFKKSMSDDEKEKEQEKLDADSKKIIEGSVEKEKVTDKDSHK